MMTESENTQVEQAEQEAPLQQPEIESCESASGHSKLQPGKISNPTNEERLGLAIEKMENSLSQNGHPDFKSFWESKKQCLELFKEDISPAIKSVHWSKYRELTKEAKRLKDILEEQTAFAVEQIEIAIKAIENDIADFTTQLEKISDLDFPNGINTLKGNLASYRDKQRELNLLNTYAARINSLRKELIRTEMRIRQKNKFFQRLSAAGDNVFPKRKELIKEISDLFAQDITTFVKHGFSGQLQEKSLHLFRDEIKNLQAAAKLLTLNTHAFTQTRLLLSECWDKLKAQEKEKKKEQAQQKLAHKENAKLVHDRIAQFSEAIKTSKWSLGEAQKEYAELTHYMRTVELGRDEVKELKEELSNAYQPLKDKLKEDEKKRREIELGKEQERQKKINDLEAKIGDLANDAKKLSISDLSEKIKLLDKEAKSIELNDFERDSLERQFDLAKDALSEKEEREVLSLSNSDSGKLGKLKSVLSKVVERRNVIKEQLDKYRKACGSSGLDFEQSMYFNEQLNAEKARLEKVNSEIAELESSIAECRG